MKNPDIASLPALPPEAFDALKKSKREFLQAIEDRLGKIRTKSRRQENVDGGIERLIETFETPWEGSIGPESTDLLAKGTSGIVEESTEQRKKAISMDVLGGCCKMFGRIAEMINFDPYLPIRAFDHASARSVSKSMGEYTQSIREETDGSIFIVVTVRRIEIEGVQILAVANMEDGSEKTLSGVPTVLRLPHPAAAYVSASLRVGPASRKRLSEEGARLVVQPLQ